MPPFRSRKELAITAVILALAVPGAALDLVIVFDAVIHGDVLVDYSVTGDLERWWQGVFEGNEAVGNLLWLAMSIAGIPVVVGVTIAPGLALAWLLSRYDRPTRRPRGSGNTGR